MPTLDFLLTVLVTATVSASLFTLGYLLRSQRD